MKTQKILIAITVLSLLIVSCKKNSSTPANTAKSVTTSTLTASETLLIGNWCYDKFEIYNNGVMPVGGTYTYNDSTVYHLRFNSTAKQSPLDPTAVSGTYKECVDGTSGTDFVNYWQITTSGKLNIGGTTYTIDLLSATQLRIYTGSMITGSAQKFYFHKI